MRLASTPITAIVYSHGDDVDSALLRIADQMKIDGLRLAGFVQRNEPRDDRERCDMVLEELWSGETIKISEDRGAKARGCRLNVDRLLAAAGTVRDALVENPDLLVINKFGKAESEGGGLRHLIVEALEREVPVLVAVPWRNLENWRLFSEGLSTEVPFAEWVERRPLPTCGGRIVSVDMNTKYGEPESSNVGIQPEGF